MYSYRFHSGKVCTFAPKVTDSCRSQDIPIDSTVAMCASLHLKLPLPIDPKVFLYVDSTVARCASSPLKLPIPIDPKVFL